MKSGLKVGKSDGYSPGDIFYNNIVAWSSVNFPLLRGTFTNTLLYGKLGYLL